MSKQLAIIGGGIVGLNLAIFAREKGFDVTVFEAGDDLPGGSNLDTGGEINSKGGYFDLSTTRVSALSGTGWVWGGNSRPFDPADFDPLGVGSPDWLIQHDALQPYLPRACGLLNINHDFGLVSQFGNDFPKGPFFEPRLYQLSPQINSDGTLATGVTHVANKVLLEGMDIQLRSHVIGLGATQGRVRWLEYQGPDGQITRRAFDHFVLALGGIENSRFLLMEAARQSSATRWVQDNIGLFFREHPHPHVANCQLDPVFAESAKARRNAQDDKNVVTVKYSLIDRSAIPGPPLSHTIQLVNRKRREGTYATSINEQMPSRLNRVELSDMRDDFGRPLARLSLNNDKVTKQRIYDSTILFARYLGSHSRSRIQLQISAENYVNPVKFNSGGHHHMGGTCMGIIEAGGVVDDTCKVWGMSNLAVAGGSVFSRDGSVNPTLNALTLGMYALDRM